MVVLPVLFSFTDTATTGLYTLSLHDALPILTAAEQERLYESVGNSLPVGRGGEPHDIAQAYPRSEEHTSELQSPYDLVCRLLLEKKKSSCRSLSPRRTLRRTAVRVFTSVGRH